MGDNERLPLNIYCPHSYIDLLSIIGNVHSQQMKNFVVTKKKDNLKHIL